MASQASQHFAPSWPVEGLWGLEKGKLENYHVHHPSPEPVLNNIPLHQGATAGGRPCVIPDEPHDEIIVESFNQVTDQQVKDGRAYACHNCLRDGTAFRAAYNDYDRHIWGFDEPNRSHHGPPTPVFGCSCGQKLVQSTMCKSHRLEQAAIWVESTEKVRNWMNQIWGAKVCPFCMSYPKGESPVDVHDFQGYKGGAGISKVVYLCLSCQDIVIVPREMVMKSMTSSSPAPHKRSTASKTRNMGNDGGCSTAEGSATSGDGSPARSDELAHQFDAGLWNDAAAAQGQTPAPNAFDSLEADLSPLANWREADYASWPQGVVGDGVTLFNDAFGDMVQAARSGAGYTSPGQEPRASPPQVRQPSPTPAPSSQHSSPAGSVAFDEFVRLSPSPSAAADFPQASAGPGVDVAAAAEYGAPVTDDSVAPAGYDYDSILREIDDYVQQHAREADNSGGVDAGAGTPDYNGDEDDFYLPGDDNDNVSNGASPYAGSAVDEEVAADDGDNADFGGFLSPPVLPPSETPSPANTTPAHPQFDRIKTLPRLRSRQYSLSRLTCHLRCRLRNPFTSTRSTTVISSLTMITSTTALGSITLSVGSRPRPQQSVS